MVGTVSYKIHGLDKLQAKLHGLGPVVARKIGSDALTAGAKPIVTRAKAMVPVKTGDLKRSIISRAIKTSGSLLSRVIGFKSPGRYYAHLVEYGTRHSAAKPFLRPAMDAGYRDSILATGARLWRGIEAYCLGRILTSLKEDNE